MTSRSYAPSQDGRSGSAVLLMQAASKHSCHTRVSWHLEFLFFFFFISFFWGKLCWHRRRKTEKKKIKKSTAVWSDKAGGSPAASAVTFLARRVCCAATCGRTNTTCTRVVFSHLGSLKPMLLGQRGVSSRWFWFACRSLIPHPESILR